MTHADLQPPPQPIALWWVVLPEAFSTALQRRHLAHQAVRDLLGQHLGIAPEQVRAQRDVHGKPHTVEGQDVSFSLSHSGGFALVAISAGAQALGVDVQVRAQLRDADGVARRIGGPLPATSVDESDRAAWHWLVCRTWVCKEAAAKALGTGLSTPLRSVRLRPVGEPPKAHALTEWRWRRPDGDVFVRELEAPTGTVAALAVLGPIGELAVHHYPGPVAGWDPDTALIHD